MKGIKTVSVRDLVLNGEAELTTGPFGTQLKAGEYVESGVPLINVRNVGFGQVRADNLEYLSDETALRLVRHRLEAGDIVFGRKGAVERHAYISAGQVGWVQGSDCIRLRLSSEYFIPRFVSYFLLTDRHQQWMKNHCSGAATMASLNQEILGRIELPTVDLQIQRKIAAILSAYDDLIENNNRRIKLLEEMAQRIYREWFVDFRYPGHEGVPLVNSEFGRIPEGWMARPLSDLVSTQYGYTESATSKPIGPRFLRGMDINKTSYVDWSSVPYCPIAASDFDRYRLVRGDVLVIRMADPGKVGIVEQDVNAVFASYLIRVRPVDTRIDPYVLFYFMSSDRYQSFVSGASTGTTRKSLSAPLITSISIALPPLELQILFVNQVAQLRDLITGLVRSNTTLRNSRDLLLPRLISGDIDVTNLNIAWPEAAA